MRKKILIILGIILALLLGGYQWLKWQLTRGNMETITAELDTKTLFDTRCGICHGGGSLEAPTLESLKLFPKERIVYALKSGVMMNQSSMLTDEQHLALADYISEVDESEINTVIKGLCTDETTAASDNPFPQIDDWGMGSHNKRYIAETSINSSNVKNLELDWVFAFPNATRARVQPTVSGNTLYTASQMGTIYALDRHTGCIRWTFQADSEVRSALVIDRDSTGQAVTLFFSDFNASVYALNLRTKELLWKVKVDDHPNATITGTLALFEDKMFIPVSSLEVISAVDENYECCTFRGSLVSLNKSDGSLNWKSYTIDDTPSPHGHNEKGTTIMGPSGAPIWTSVTVDPVRRRLYVGTGENYSRPATGTSDAIIAFNADNGQKTWINQALADDAWNGACVTINSRANCPENNGPDADFGAPPILLNSTDGDIILAGQKSGYVYAMDPDNQGRTLWHNLIGRGGTMGGIHWGMATDGTTLYVPINDRGVYDLHKDIDPAPGLHAVDIVSGEKLWSTIEEDRCPPLTLRGCGPGLSAAITATPEVIFAGTLDGYFKAYAAKGGQELWSFDTKRAYDAVNGARAFGGAIDSDGPVIVDDQVFITSGYNRFAEKEGNVLLAFKLDE